MAKRPSSATETKPEATDRRWDALSTRAATFEPMSYDAETREIDLVWSTGADVTRMDWRSGGTYIERLSMDPKSVGLERLNAGAPVLDSHMSYELANVIGAVVPGSARIEKGVGLARVRLSAASDVADAVTKVAEGIVRNVSIGYSVDAWDVKASKDGSPETRTATSWQPYEISMVPIPADARAQTRSAEIVDSAELAHQEPETPAQERVMSEQTNIVDLDAARSAAVAAERARVAEIGAISQRHGLDLSVAINEGKSVEQARAMALEALAAKQAETSTSNTHGGIRTGRSHSEQVIEGIANAIEHRANPKAELTAAGASMRSLPLVRMAALMLREQGVNTDLMSDREIARRALAVGSRRSFVSSLATGDFPYLLANVANKFLLQGYGAEPMTHLAFSYQRVVNDLKQVSTVRTGSITALPKVLENGEYTYASFGEEREVYTVAKYGKILPMSLEMMINDDLSAFSILAQELGRAAGRTELDLVYGTSGVFGANSSAGETMGDGNNLFDAANHGNLAAAHTALDDTGLAALRLLLRNQTDLAGNNINLMPRHLLVPAALETTAEKLINGSFMPTTAANGQVGAFRNLNLIVEPRVDNLANGTARYYMMSDRPWIELGKLAGYETPTIETIEEMEADQIGYKVRYFVAAKATDWRMVACDPGA